MNVMRCLSVAAALTVASLAQTVLSSVNFDCGAPGPYTGINGFADCSGVFGTTSASVTNVNACGFPTNGANWARVLATNFLNIPAGGPLPRPITGATSELRIAVPANATGLAFNWEFFNAEGISTTHRDGISIDLCDSVGVRLANYVYADAAVTALAPGGCNPGFGTESGANGPQSVDIALPYPRPTGCYLSVACWNGADLTISSSAAIDNVRFTSYNDSCSRALPLFEGTRYFTNAGATPTTAQTTCGHTTTRDVWFAYLNTHACAETVTISTCAGVSEPSPALADTVLGVFTSCGSSCLAGNDDACGLRSSVTFNLGPFSTALISVSSFSTNLGNNFTITVSSTSATKSLVGTGCGVNPPLLDSSIPQLAANYTLNLTNAEPNSSGYMFYGSQGGPLPFGGGCTLWIAPTGLSTLFPLATDSLGNWTFTVPLPADPAFDCLSLALQAFVGTSNGVSFSNGLNITLGY